MLLLRRLRRSAMRRLPRRCRESLRGGGLEVGEHSRNSPWRSGQAVFHTKFGEGVIVNLEGSGADARVQVNFRKAGVKWLALEYAKLTAL